MSEKWRAKKLIRVCAIFGDWDGIDIASLRCAEGSHYHFSQQEAKELIENEVAEWVKEPKGPGERGVIRFFKEPGGSARGLSCKAGGYLQVRALEERAPWALLMLSEVLRDSASSLPDEKPRRHPTGSVRAA